MSKWNLPGLAVTRPNRAFTGIYRSADGQRDGEAIAGVPLQAASDAVVAAVKLGYKVADAQIERGRRLARGLNSAARRGGMPNASDPVDAAEHLLIRMAQLGLEWVEGAALEPGGSLRRLTQAQYEAIGSLLGLRRASAGAPPQRATDERSPEGAGTRPVQPPPPPDASAFDWAAKSAATQQPASSTRMPAVRHKQDSVRRHVRVLKVEVTGTLPSEDLNVTFYYRDDPQRPVLCGTLTVHAEELRLVTDASHPAGRWSGALCDADGLQIGLVEIEL
jgi:hypothetical protein